MLDIVMPLLTAHWQAVMMTVVLAMIGQFMSTRVFTTTRVVGHICSKRFCAECAKKLFWHWGHETLPVQPIAAGLLWGRFWLGGVNGMSEGAFAGAASLVLWIYIKGQLKANAANLWLFAGNAPAEEKADAPTS